MYPGVQPAQRRLEESRPSPSVLYILAVVMIPRAHAPGASSCNMSVHGISEDRSDIAGLGARQHVPQVPNPPRIQVCTLPHAGGTFTFPIPGRQSTAAAFNIEFILMFALKLAQLLSQP
ncbi:uncharacterized protein B0H18DRAFT_958263 [Fomitopsis serialis]|uniref:uncharacterized protein n=1 Tax=Fomitopsis serialis TaxID=139415 RepID=UPI00200861CC|nr:uncharacterized protein B0H18DRAFT_958263 [Neoantrodia serialis]KAH9917581.1 hypothetical protein B0H18DRAFT_958263 [Neoantrodia serialis]